MKDSCIEGEEKDEDEGGMKDSCIEGEGWRWRGMKDSCIEGEGWRWRRNEG